MVFLELAGAGIALLITADIGRSDHVPRAAAGSDEAEAAAGGSDGFVCEGGGGAGAEACVVGDGRCARLGWLLVLGVFPPAAGLSVRVERDGL